MQEAFKGVPVALEKLDALFPGADIPRVAERQPFLLIDNCDELLDEMLR